MAQEGRQRWKRALVMALLAIGIVALLTIAVITVPRGVDSDPTVPPGQHSSP